MFKLAWPKINWDKYLRRITQPQYAKVGLEIAQSVVKHTRWKPDCQGKQDFDCDLIGVDVRFYPNSPNYNKEYESFCSANASLLLYLDGNRQSNYLTLAYTDIKGVSEADVKQKIEDWVKIQSGLVTTMMLHLFSPGEQSVETALKEVRRYS